MKRSIRKGDTDAVFNRSTENGDTTENHPNINRSDSNEEIRFTIDAEILQGINPFSVAVIGLWLLVGTLVVQGSPSEDNLIVPGKSVGRVAIGETKAKIKKQIGLGVSKTWGANKYDDDEWHYEAKDGNWIRINFKEGKVDLICFTSPKFCTQSGLNSASPLSKLNSYRKSQHLEDPGNEGLRVAGKKIKNLRFVFPSGGLAFYKFDIDNVEPEQRDLSHCGVVFTGLNPPNDNPLDWSGSD